MFSRSPLGRSTGSQSIPIDSRALSRTSSRPLDNLLYINTSGSAPPALRSSSEVYRLRDGVLDLLEEVLVIDDVTELLVLAVQPVRAADSLEQAMVLHALVNIQISAVRSIEAGEEHVHDDQQLHVRGPALEHLGCERRGGMSMAEIALVFNDENAST